jgi:hypothetical protein
MLSLEIDIIGGGKTNGGGIDFDSDSEIELDNQEVVFVNPTY